MSESYFNSSINSANANTLHAGGGLFGYMITTNGTVGSSTRIQACYVVLDGVIPGTIQNSFAVLGQYGNVFTQGLAQWDDVYFQASPAFVGAAGEGELTNNPEVNQLNSPQSLQKTSYVGPLWDFNSTWQIDEGVSSPTLRPGS